MKRRKVTLYSYREQQKQNMEKILELCVKVFAGILACILIIILIGAVIF